VFRNFLRSRASSFRHAFTGWGYVLRTQPNAWIHAGFTLAVILIGIWLELSTQKWAILLLAITLVWTAELINTAVEAVVDLASPDHHQLAKAGKDTAAGAVLAVAAGSILVGLLILGPPLWDKLRALFH
jgi:diacylglycerol kinase (ATP)